MMQLSVSMTGLTVGELRRIVAIADHEGIPDDVLLQCDEHTNFLILPMPNERACFSTTDILNTPENTSEINEEAPAESDGAATANPKQKNLDYPDALHDAVSRYMRTRTFPLDQVIASALANAFLSSKTQHHKDSPESTDDDAEHEP